MQVILVRHGIAHDRLDPACPPDPERALTPEGLKKTAEAARGLGRLRPTPARHLTSPYVRARQTADIFREVIAPGCPLSETEALLPDAEPHLVLREIASSTEDIVLYGHAPNLDRVAALLTGARESAFRMKKAGVVVIEHLDHPVPGQGAVVLCATPKVLRLLADAG